MKCPNCNKKMKYKDKGYWAYPITLCIEPDYPEWVRKNVYKCKECKIKNINDEWKIPDKLKPTAKQINTILFINYHLNLNLQTITKKQCWLDINKYFKKAKKYSLYHDDGNDDYLQEYFGFPEIDFF